MRSRLASWIGVSAMMALPCLANAPKRVLIVHSFGNAAPPFTTASTAFETTLTAEMGEPVDLDEVYLDVARYATLEMEEALVDLMRKRQTRWQPDLVVPIGSPAGIFVARYRDRLVPKTTPIIYAGMDQRRLPAGALGENATFVGASYDLAGAVEDILQLAPATTNIVMLIGASPLEQYWAEVLRKEYAVFTNRVGFTWFNDLSFEQIRARSAKLPPHSFMLLILFMRDASGVTHNANDALRQIHRVANAPINGLFNEQLGLGIVGGRIYSDDLEGRESARIAARILRGEAATNFPAKIIGPSTPRYDWRELQRWKISENRLPPGSKILFREPTVWERYQWRIIGALSIILVQTGLIALLVTGLTRRRRMERQLRESEARFRIVADSAPVLIWMSGVDKLCTFFNKPWLDFTGRTAEQEMGIGWSAGVHPDDLAGCLKTYHESFDSRQPFVMQYRLRRHDGEFRWVSDNGVPRYGPHGRFAGYIGSCSDITDRRLAEERFQQIFEASPSAMIMVSQTGRIVLASRQTEQVFGYRNEELLGLSIEDLIPERFRLPHAALRESFARDPQARLMGSGREIFGRRKDGKEVPVEIHLNPIYTSEGFFVLASVVDITERQHNAQEIQRLRLEAWHADRVARTGAITSSLAHELNQPLAAILSNAQAALRFMAGKNPDLDEIREILGDIVRDDKRAGAVISGLRTMLRRKESQHESIALGATLQEVLDLLHSELLSRRVEIRLRREAECTAVGDKAQITQVVLNLVMNAAEAVQALPFDRRRVEVILSCPDPETAQISVRDSGPGVSDEYASKLFEAFWTTKPQGMGIGLSICRSIVEVHGGRIWLANNKAGETTFRFTLPAVKSSPPEPRATSAAEAISRRVA